MSPLAKLIAEAIVGAVNGVINVATKSGVSAEDIEAGKQDALAQITDIGSAEAAAHARQWRIAQGLEP
jgi:hypothetical protein